MEGGTGYLCAPGFENRLSRGSSMVCPGFVVDASPPADPAFGRQVLPDLVEVRGGSVNALARGAAEVIAGRLDEDPATWRLDVLVTDAPADPNQPGELSRRAALAERRIVETLHRTRRRLLRRCEPGGEAVAQVLLIARDRLVVSVAHPEVLPGGSRWPSPFPGGRAAVEDDPMAPSRAYRKLREALAWMGEAPGPGDRCVDLGAAPGGWTHVVAALGAHVESVDRAALAPALMDHPRVTHRRGDAFRYEPEGPVDWLLCDVIAAPERSLELLTRWAERRWFRRAVLHLKFKGEPPPGIIGEARRALAKTAYRRSRIKHLLNDRNEVTVMGG